ncbi:MAG: EscU/YscU/HrcU family type III secretion system export apparatus switch protein [Phycisphaerales bacterium]|nr:EscU/YscU/HrcU family type III secretion system export apparatus switch protein [Phycisphaerales bacterium]
MADGSGNRTEPPSAKRLREARRLGLTPVSHAGIAWAVLLAAGIVIWIRGPGMIATIGDAITLAIGAVSAAEPSLSVAAQVARAAGELGVSALIVMGAAMFAGVLAGFVQVGPMWSSRPFAPRFVVGSPWGILFSRRTFAGIGKGWLWLGLGLAVATCVIGANFVSIARLGGVDVSLAGSWTAGLLGRIAILILLAAAALVIADIVHQRLRFTRSLRMTREETICDYREEHGDPQMRDRQRAGIDEMMGVAAIVTRLEVIIADQSVACGIAWDGREGSTPVVLTVMPGGGSDLVNAGSRAGIPVLRRASLAQHLAKVPGGWPIPEALFAQVAEALRWAEEESERSGRRVGWAL